MELQGKGSACCIKIKSRQTECSGGDPRIAPLIDDAAYSLFPCTGHIATTGCIHLYFLTIRTGHFYSTCSSLNFYCTAGCCNCGSSRSGGNANLSAGGSHCCGACSRRARGGCGHIDCTRRGCYCGCSCSLPWRCLCRWWRCLLASPQDNYADNHNDSKKNPHYILLFW